jgi:uncharacterized protein YcfL
VHRRSMLVSALIVAVFALAGCGDDSSGDNPKNDGSTKPEVIKITITGDSVTPNGKKVDVAINQPVTLDVTADEAGEIHVHSTPEQEIAYDAGESTHTITIDRPGVVEVESHALEKVIVQLQVR